jgi:hypothetical protein
MGGLEPDYDQADYPEVCGWYKGMGLVHYSPVVGGEGVSGRPPYIVTHASSHADSPCVRLCDSWAEIDPANPSAALRDKAAAHLKDEL